MVKANLCFLQLASWCRFLIDAGQEVLGNPQSVLQERVVRVAAGRVLEQVLAQQRREEVKPPQRLSQVILRGIRADTHMKHQSAASDSVHRFIQQGCNRREGHICQGSGVRGQGQEPLTCKTNIW